VHRGGAQGGMVKGGAASRTSLFSRTCAAGGEEQAREDATLVANTTLSPQPTWRGCVASRQTALAGGEG